MQIHKSRIAGAMKGALLVLATAVAIPALAATDGPTAQNETSGTMDVSVDLSSVVAITGLDDISFGSHTPGVTIALGESIEQVESFCVFSNADTGFTLAFESDNGGAAGPFTMIGGTYGESLGYNVALEFGEYFNSAFTYTQMTPSAMKQAGYGNFSYSDSYYVDNNCNSSSGLEENIRLTFSMAGDDGAAVRPDAYSDTLTIIARVAPELP